MNIINDAVMYAANTSDDNNLPLLIAVGAVALVAVVLLGVIGKKRK